MASDSLQAVVATSAQWHATLPPPLFSSPVADAERLSIRRYVETPPEMRQPALSENLLVMHLGGAKRVRRGRDGHVGLHEVGAGALTVLPAGRGNLWQTEGPIDFAHLTLARPMLNRVLLEEYGRDPDRCELTDVVGLRNGCLEEIFRRLLTVGESGSSSRLHVESLLVVLIVELLRVCSAGAATGEVRSPSRPCKGGMSGWRLKRVCGYMRDHLAEDIRLTDLTALAGLSRAQFFRAFKQSTGLSPSRFLTRLRMDRARSFIDASGFDAPSVGEAVGIANGARFTALFKARFGMTPRCYRRSRV